MQQMQLNVKAMGHPSSGQSASFPTRLIVIGAVRQSVTWPIYL